MRQHATRSCSATLVPATAALRNEAKHPASAASFRSISGSLSSHLRAHSALLNAPAAVSEALRRPSLSLSLSLSPLYGPAHALS